MYVHLRVLRMCADADVYACLVRACPTGLWTYRAGMYFGFYHKGCVVRAARGSPPRAVRLTRSYHPHRFLAILPEGASAEPPLSNCGDPTGAELRVFGCLPRARAWHRLLAVWEW